jgi:hypothetical protein
MWRGPSVVPSTIILGVTLEPSNRKVATLVPVPGAMEYGVLFEHLEVLRWQKRDRLGDVKARRGEFLDGLRLGKLCRKIDVHHASAKAESAVQLGIKFRTALDAVKHVVKHNDVDGMLGRVIQLHQANAIRDSRREERLGLEQHDHIGSLEGKRANQLIGSASGFVLSERGQNGADGRAK